MPETKPSAPPPPISTPYSRPPSTVSSPSRLGRRLSSQLPSTDVVPGIASSFAELGQGNASAERSLHGRGSAARDRGVGGCQVFGIVHEAVRMLLPSAPRGVASVTPPAVRATVCPLSKTEDSRDRTRAGMTPGAVVLRSGTSMPPGRRQRSGRSFRVSRYREHGAARHRAKGAVVRTQAPRNAPHPVRRRALPQRLLLLARSGSGRSGETS